MIAVLKSQSWPEALDNLGSGSWLARAGDTAAHYAAIHCPRWRTVAAHGHTTTSISHMPCLGKGRVYTDSHFEKSGKKRFIKCHIVSLRWLHWWSYHYLTHIYIWRYTPHIDTTPCDASFQSLRTDFTDTRTALRLFSPFQWACQNFQCKSSIVSYRIVFSPDPANKLAWKNVKFALVKLHIFSITAIYSIRVTFNYCRVSSSDDVVSVSGQILTPYVQILSRFGVETITRLQQMGGRRESQACSQ